MKKTFTGRIRKAAKALTPNTFTRRDLSITAEIKTRENDRRLGFVIQDMKKSGEIKSVNRGVYQYVGRKENEMQICEIMYRYLRFEHHTTLDEIMEVSGASRGYAGQWLRMLKEKGVVAEKNGRYRLIKDPGVNGMPENEKKAKSLRALRQKKKEQALKALDRAEAAIKDAREAMGG